jgi:hypothetical protein
MVHRKRGKKKKRGGLRGSKILTTHKKLRYALSKLRKYYGVSKKSARRWVGRHHRMKRGIRGSLWNAIFKQRRSGKWVRGTGGRLSKPSFGGFSHHWSFKTGHRLRRKGHRGFYSMKLYKRMKRRRHARKHKKM